jgi:predicted cation transporter
MKENIANKKGKETFESIKDVLESIRLKELRFNNIEAAYKLGQVQNKEVRITYHTDNKKNIKTDGIIWEFDGKVIVLNNLRRIPVRAIKKVEFFSDN